MPHSDARGSTHNNSKNANAQRKMMESTTQMSTVECHTLTRDSIKNLIIAELSGMKVSIKQEMTTLLQMLEADFLRQLTKVLVEASNSTRNAYINQLVLEALKAKLMD